MLGRLCNCCSEASAFQKLKKLSPSPRRVCLSPAAALPARFIPAARPEAFTWRSYRLLSSSWRVVLSLPFITLFTALCLCRSVCSSPPLIGAASVGAQILLSLPVSALPCRFPSIHWLQVRGGAPSNSVRKLHKHNLTIKGEN